MDVKFREDLRKIGYGKYLKFYGSVVKLVLRGFRW